MPSRDGALDLVTSTWPGRSDGPAVVLLHGSGQDETSLLEFARSACPDRELVAVRGRIPWEDGFAFFRRHPDRSLDEDDLSRGAAALRRLLVQLGGEGRRRPLLLGCSNGAIAAAATLAVDHQLAFATVLLRPLSPRPEGDFPRLDGHPVLLVSGAHDQRRDPCDGPILTEQLRRAGARVVAEHLPTGHGLTAADEALVREWLAGLTG